MYVLVLWAALCSLGLASPAPTAVAAAAPAPAAALVNQPLITTPPSKTFKHRRDVFSDIGSVAGSIGNGAESVFGSIGGEAGSYVDSLLSGASSFVASGVQSWEVSLPTGSAVLSSAGVNSSQLNASPTSVLNIPPYGNWTNQGWNVRFHGNVYKTPNISSSKLNDLANFFLIGTSVQQLTPQQSAQAINVTQEIFVVQQENQQPVFNLEPAPSAGSSGESGGGGAVTPGGGSQTVVYPSYNTTAEGDFDAFLPIQLNGLQPGNQTNQIQRLNVYTQGTDSGNATAYLVPPYGLTIVSDIDDILRVTKIYEPKEGLLNTFAYPFTPWQNMPAIYANWSAHLNLGGNATHFHYLTTTPEQVTRTYMQFIYSTYPGGSFDTRPLNFSNVGATLSIRKFLLDKVFQTYPQRKFVLVADTSNSDVMRDYPQMAKQYPGQVQCIFLRNTSATDPGDKFPYDTSGFDGLNANSYMFFVNADDLTGLDIANGQCRNASVPQNVTFGEQGLPLGINLGSGSSSASSSTSTGGVVPAATVPAAMMVAAGLAGFAALV